MSDPNADTAEFLAAMPTGYVYHQPSVERVRSTVCTATGSDIDGAAKRMIDGGTTYFNLKSFVAELLRRPGKGGVKTSRRRLIDCGSDGVVLEPLQQRTGICNGCSHGEAAFVSMCARYVMTGCGPLPREFLFLWPYLLGRELSITGTGDSGSCPPYTIQGYHDIGCCPVDCGGKYNFLDMPPHGDDSQESLCVAMRDNPRMPQEWRDAAAPYVCRVFSPSGAWAVADCIATGRAVTKGSGYQIAEADPRGNGVSRIVSLGGGGHETYFEGFAIIGGRLHLITMESWGAFPASGWRDHRVTIQVDGVGAVRLYPGQGCVPAEDYIARCWELWSVDAPGGNA